MLLFLSILVPLLTASLTVLNSWKNWKKDKKRTRTIKLSIAISCGIIACLIAILNFNQAQKTIQLKANSGTLPTPRNTLLSANGSLFPGVTLKFGPNAFPIVASQINLNGGVEIYEENGNIKLNARIRDKSGQLIAEIIDNEWTLNHNYMFDRNYSNNALEVINNYGNVVLQLQYISNVILFQGVVFNDQGKCVAFWEGNDGRGQAVMYGSVETNFTVPIKRIFKYPSWEHLGKYSKYGPTNKPFAKRLGDFVNKSIDAIGLYAALINLNRAKQYIDISLRNLTENIAPKLNLYDISNIGPLYIKNLHITIYADTIKTASATIGRGRSTADGGFSVSYSDIPTFMPGAKTIRTLNDLILMFGSDDFIYAEILIQAHYSIGPFSKRFLKQKRYIVQPDSTGKTFWREVSLKKSKK
jgi:hypothetical protein